MSAYQVDYECIGRVLALIIKVDAGGPNYKDICQLKEDIKNGGSSVFDRLLSLNRFSLRERYPNDFKSLYSSVNAEKAVWFSQRMGHDNYQLVSSLKCLLYQSCEGKASETRLYKTLLAIKNSFCESLVEIAMRQKEESGEASYKWG